MLVDKKAAANRIDAIIHEVLTAPIKLSKKTSKDSCCVKTVKTRVKRVKQELGDVADAVKEVGNQLGDVGSAVKGKTRKGRKPKKK